MTEAGEGKPITSSTRVLAVLGHPVAHSISPQMHSAAIRKLGLDFIYAAFDVAASDLEHALRGVAALGISGVNVTVPLKEAAYHLVDRAVGDAIKLRAVNTVVTSSGTTTGFNTDVVGFSRCLNRHMGFTIKGRHLSVLGAGGAARAVILASLNGSASRISVICRDIARGRRALASMGVEPETERVHCLQMHSDGVTDVLSKSDLLVNATPVGMWPHDDELPPIPLERLKETCVVFDLIYNPTDTLLMRTTAARGHRAFNGLPMLVEQGAESFRIFTGLEPDRGAMMGAAEEALAQFRSEI